MKVNEEAIRNLIKENGWTVTRLAAELGLQRTWLSAILNGHKNPSSGFVGAFMKRFPDHDLRMYFSA